MQRQLLRAMDDKIIVILLEFTMNLLIFCRNLLSFFFSLIVTPLSEQKRRQEKKNFLDLG